MSDDEKNPDRGSQFSTVPPSATAPEAPAPAASDVRAPVAPARPPRPSPMRTRALADEARSTPTMTLMAPVTRIAFLDPPLRLTSKDIPNDRPTPRSTVIPRLPPVSMPLPGMRPKLETLIFHGAPPVAPSTPRPHLPPPGATARLILPPPPPPSSASAFQDVHSTELLSEIDLEDDDGDMLYPAGGTAHTDRPPPMLRARRQGDRRLVVGLLGALAVPIALAALLLGRNAHESHLSPVQVAAPSKAAAAPAPTRLRGTCVTEGSPKLLARRALVRGGVEGAAADDRVAFAALSSTKSGTAFELDPRTLAVKSSARVVATDPVQHVVPELTDEAPVEAATDVGGLRTIADPEGDTVFGVRDGYASWGPRDGDGMVRLWKLGFPATVEAPRVVALGTSGERAVAFRRAGAIWIGSFNGGQTTSELTKLSISPHAGAPALDAHGEEAVIAWAEREAQSPWGIRWTRWTAHAGPEAVHELALPAGGPGDRAMAPSVAALGDGRFLLAWTEAGRGRNQVRAQVIDATDRPLGEPLLVSAIDAVAGQEAIALNDAGRGAIAYLVAKRGSFELRATGIDCAP